MAWMGGKWRLLRKLLPLIPDHQTYVEAFGGGATLLLSKSPSAVEVYNDLDSGIVNFFRILRDKERFKEFHRLISLTPYSREEFCSFLKEVEVEGEGDIDRAHKWFAVARQSFSGMFGNSWGYTVRSSSRGMPECTSSYLGVIERLPEVCQRIMRVMIEHRDALKLLSRFDGEETFYYLDPPYLPGTRRAGKYRCDMTTKEHEVLIDLLPQLKGKVMLSGYRSRLYERLEEAGWQRRDFNSKMVLSGNTLRQFGSGIEKDRIESVWMNYAI